MIRERETGPCTRYVSNKRTSLTSGLERGREGETELTHPEFEDIGEDQG